MSWFRLNKAAEYADVSPKTITRWFKDGLRHSRVNGTPYVKDTWLDEWMQSHEINEQTIDDIVEDVLNEF